MEIKRKYTDREICQIHKNENGMEYITFPGIESTGVVEHMFTTRLGGVSEGIYRSLNVSYTRGDDARAVDENFRRVASCMHGTVDQIVCTDQTHTTNIRVAGLEDRGKGVVRALDYHDIDGLITNESGLILAGFVADCVPLIFVDPVHHAIGVAHSGWRGTVGKIGLKMVSMMQAHYGTDPAELYAAIGPSICQDCYEVSEDVIDKVRENFAENLWERLFYKKDFTVKNEMMSEGKMVRTGSTQDTKYQFNLWETNRQVMLESGILPSRIEVTDLCTCCNPEYLFSHRASHGKRGNLGVFLKLKEKTR